MFEYQKIYLYKNHADGPSMTINGRTNGVIPSGLYQFIEGQICEEVFHVTGICEIINQAPPEYQGKNGSTDGQPLSQDDFNKVKSMVERHKNIRFSGKKIIYSDK